MITVYTGYEDKINNMHLIALFLLNGVENIILFGTT